MSEIKDRQDAASDIDPIVAAMADDTTNDTANDTWAAAAVEGLDEATEPAGIGDFPVDEPSAIEASAPDLSHSPHGIHTDADATAGSGEAEPADPVQVEATSPPVEVDFDLTDEALELTVSAAPADVPAEPLMADDFAYAIEAALMADQSDAPVLPEPVAEADVSEDAQPEPLLHVSYASSFADMPAAYADTIVELDDLETDDDGPLLDVDLEDGIASVFAALQAAAENNAPVEPLGDLEAADGVTFRLLGELDRLWHRAA